jgi:hypothetical protein
MSFIRPAAALASATLLAFSVSACDLSDEGGPRIESAADARELPDDSDDVFFIQTTDDAMKLGLTDEAIYMRFSDETLRKIDREMEEEAGEREGIAGAITSAVTGAVSKGLRTRISFVHENIRDIRWEEGRLVVELENGEHAFGDMEVEDEDVTRKFDEDDVREFIEEWRAVKDALEGAG